MNETVQGAKAAGSSNTTAPAKKADTPPRKPAKRAAAKPGKLARKATFRRRHGGLALSLLLTVALPSLLTALYLMLFAQPQYASETGFVIRQEEGTSASQMLGGLNQVLGTQGASNSDLLFEFIQSPDIVRRIQDEIDITTHYMQTWPADPVYSVWPGITIEGLVTFWRRMVRITYNQSSGVIMVEVRARDPQMAQRIASEIVAQSEQMINMLNAAARRDSMTNAQNDLEEAITSLRTAREAMIAFQARTQILDPQADIQGRMGVLANLQQQLAQSLIDYDLLLQSADANDPRVRQLSRRIAAIEDRIAQERESFAAQNVTVDNTSYPMLLAQNEGLRVDVQFAEENYRAALTALTQARTSAERQKLYLATFISPTLPETATYPKRPLLIALTMFFSLMVWAVGALVYYSFRDRS